MLDMDIEIDGVLMYYLYVKILLQKLDISNVLWAMFGQKMARII